MPIPFLCFVCEEALNIPNNVWQTECNHLFHYSCIYFSLLRIPECPECNIPTLKYKLVKTDQHVEETQTLKTQLEESLKNSSDLEERLNECLQNFEFLKEVNAQLELCCKNNSDLQKLLENSDKTVESLIEVKAQLELGANQGSELQELELTCENNVAELKRENEELAERLELSNKRMLENEKTIEHLTKRMNNMNMIEREEHMPNVLLDNVFKNQKMLQDIKMLWQNSATSDTTNTQNKHVCVLAEKNCCVAKENAIEAKDQLIADLEQKLRTKSLALELETQNSMLLSVKLLKLQTHLIATNLPDAARMLIKQQKDVLTSSTQQIQLAAGLQPEENLLDESNKSASFVDDDDNDDDVFLKVKY